MSAPELIALIIALALLFDFVNGFHDAANSIATVVATRVLKPGQAVGMAASFNFFAALLLGTGVAATVGEGFVNMNVVTPYVILARLDWRLRGRSRGQGGLLWIDCGEMV